MKTNPAHEGAFNVKGAAIGPVTDELVLDRAEELALIDGRGIHEVTDADRDRAWRELTGIEPLDPQQELLESVPESARWDPVPGSPGHEAPTVLDDGEDADGRSDVERLVEEGIEEAVHEQMLEAAATPPE